MNAIFISIDPLKISVCIATYERVYIHECRDNPMDHKYIYIAPWIISVYMYTCKYIYMYVCK